MWRRGESPIRLVRIPWQRAHAVCSCKVHAMVGHTRSILGLVFAAVFVLAACTGNNSDGDTITSVPTPTVSSTTAETPTTAVGTDESSTPTTLPRGTDILHGIDPETGEIVDTEVEIPVQAGMGYHRLYGRLCQAFQILRQGPYSFLAAL